MRECNYRGWTTGLLHGSLASLKSLVWRESAEKVTTCAAVHEYASASLGHFVPFIREVQKHVPTDERLMKSSGGTQQTNQTQE